MAEFQYRNLPSKDYEKKGKKRKYLPGEKGAIEGARGGINARLHIQKREGYVDPFLRQAPRNNNDKRLSKQRWNLDKSGETLRKTFPMPVVNPDKPRKRVPTIRIFGDESAKTTKKKKTTLTHA